MKTGVSLKYFVSYFLWKHFFGCNSSQNPSNLISLTFLVTLMPFTSFKINLEQFTLVGDCFSSLFTELKT